VEALKALLRYFSYLFYGLLALFLLAVSGLTLASGGQNLHLGMLPWTGSTLAYVVFFGSILGLIALVMTVRGRLQWLFFLWSLAVAVLLIKGYVLSGYHFAAGEARTAGLLMLASLIGVLGAWFAMWASPDRRHRY
jgi:hypothetical protein